MTSAKTQQEIADIIRFPKKEKDGEEISLYIRFRECFEENFGAEYKKYLPYIEELIFNKKRNRIEVSQKYRERMQHLFRNTTIQERVLGIIMDFQLYEESPYTPLLTTHPTTK